MYPSLIEIGSKTAEKKSAQANRQRNRQTDRHYKNNRSLGREPKSLVSSTTPNINTCWQTKHHAHHKPGSILQHWQWREDGNSL